VPGGDRQPVTIAEWSGQIGVPLPHTDAAILDDDGKPVALRSGRDLPARAQVMKGTGTGRKTAKVFTADGLPAHRRHGVMDGRGNIRITTEEGHDRGVPDSGLPNEIEDVLATHPGVAEASVIGVPMPDRAEAVKVIWCARTRR